MRRSVRMRGSPGSVVIFSFRQLMVVNRDLRPLKRLKHGKYVLVVSTCGSDGHSVSTESSVFRCRFVRSRFAVIPEERYRWAQTALNEGSGQIKAPVRTRAVDETFTFRVAFTVNEEATSADIYHVFTPTVPPVGTLLLLGT